MNYVDLHLEFISTARHFYEQGWIVETTGNLSVLLPDGSFWITASGRFKGELLAFNVAFKVTKN